MDYYNKYLKYKEKYLLAKQKGGGDSIEYWLIKTKLLLEQNDTIDTILQKDIRKYISNVDPPPVVSYHNLIVNNYNDIIYGCEVFKYYITYKDSDEAKIKKIPFDLTYIKDKYPLDKTPYTDIHINIGTKFIQSYYKSVDINAIINTYLQNSNGFINTYLQNLKEALKYLVIKKQHSHQEKRLNMNTILVNY
jgi:hypothetical protein